MAIELLVNNRICPPGNLAQEVGLRIYRQADDPAEGETTMSVIEEPGRELEGQAKDWLAPLRKFAGNNLKGIERQVVELVCNGNGKATISELATDPQIQWQEPCDNACGSTIMRLNNKVKKLLFKFYRLSNSVCVEKVSKKQ